MDKEQNTFRMTPRIDEKLRLLAFEFVNRNLALRTYVR